MDASQASQEPLRGLSDVLAPAGTTSVRQLSEQRATELVHRASLPLQCGGLAALENSLRPRNAHLLSCAKPLNDTSLSLPVPTWQPAANPGLAIARHGHPSRPHRQGDVATITGRRLPQPHAPADGPAAALRAVGAPAVAVAGDRPRARQGAVGRGSPTSRGRAPLGAGVVLRGRGARDHPVLRPRHGLRGRAGGGLPHDPAGRRGAPHAVLRPLLPRGGGRGPRSSGTASRRARRRDRTRSSSCSTSGS